MCNLYSSRISTFINLGGGSRILATLQIYLNRKAKISEQKVKMLSLSTIYVWVQCNASKHNISQILLDLLRGVFPSFFLSQKNKPHIFEELRQLCAKFHRFSMKISGEIICQSWPLCTLFFNFCNALCYTICVGGIYLSVMSHPSYESWVSPKNYSVKQSRAPILTCIISEEPVCYFYFCSIEKYIPRSFNFVASFAFFCMVLDWFLVCCNKFSSWPSAD